ncbi:hypothetical protein QBC39DRAFT_177694 [Podospora conica]|nr:hypothetical protein QBC39DRAFT_177694 [Schizothecium conicum]
MENRPVRLRSAQSIHVRLEHVFIYRSGPPALALQSPRRDTHPPNKTAALPRPFLHRQLSAPGRMASLGVIDAASTPPSGSPCQGPTERVLCPTEAAPNPMTTAAMSAWGYSWVAFPHAQRQTGPMSPSEEDSGADGPFLSYASRPRRAVCHPTRRLHVAWAPPASLPQALRHIGNSAAEPPAHACPSWPASPTAPRPRASSDV